MDVDIFSNIENCIIDTKCYSLFNNKKEYKYDGKVNICINKKNIAYFPQNKDDINAINILKASPGYCIVSRSKLFKFVPLEHCISINGEKITVKNLYTYSINDIILCKLPGWKSYLPCTIKSFDDKRERLAFGEATLNLIFTSCPESDFTIAWNYSKNIIPNKSVISHINMDNVDLKKTTGENKIFYNNAPFISNIYQHNENTNENIKITTKEYIPSGFINKNELSENKQILKYNLCWIKPSVECFGNKNIFGKKSVTVAANSFSNHFTKDFLPNVRILDSEQFNKIFKIQHYYTGLMSVVPKNETTFPNIENYCNIEPQNIKQFNSTAKSAAYYLERNNYITFTGYLCENAKKYLFNI